MKKEKKKSTDKKDFVLAAKDKSAFFKGYYESLTSIEEYLSPEDIDIMTKALDVATLKIQERAAERARAELEEKERVRLEAETKKREREEQRKLIRESKIAKKKHEEHVKSVTCMDLPIDFENSFSGENDIPFEHIDSIPDALMASLDNLGCVDIEYISEVTGCEMKEVIKALEDSIYQNPLTWNECFYKGWETSDEYLSGNILYKLSVAKEANEDYLGYFDKNVEALSSLVSGDISADEIYVNLGSPWLPPDIIDDFILHLVRLNRDEDDAKLFSEEKYRVRHDGFTGIWEIPEKNRLKMSVNRWKYDICNYSTYGTDRMDMLNILEATLNQRSIQITDVVDNGKRDASGKVMYDRLQNNDETVKVVERQEKLINEFKNWVWSDPDRKARLLGAYCEKFGSVKKRIFNGSFLAFPNMNPEIKLYEHQKNAVARILFTPNTLLSHDVGSGKTYVMIAAGMELRRLKKSKKNLYVVPNNIVGQWRSTFYKMYPSANILVINNKNFKPEKRAETLERIKNEDFDAIIMPYSSFDILSLSKKYYMELYQKELVMLEKAREKFTSKGKIDAKERAIKKILEKLMNEVPNNVCTIPFDELGINTLFLDEAHYYKNVPINSAIHRVHGINKSGSDKCKGMMDKIHCIQRMNNGGRVVFATGTPITNSLTDIFVLQKYLQEGELEFAGIHTFDNWVGMFAEKTTEYEIDVDTNTYHLKTRFAKFKNIPELTAILSSVADFHHEKQPENLPKFDGYTDSVAEGSPVFKEFLHEISTRADDVRNKNVDPKTDNMLKITTDGRKAALDIRLIDLYFGRESESKVMRCAENIAQIYESTRDFGGVQLVFCDISTPKSGFNLYDELRQLLVAMGIPERRIAYIHDAQNDKDKETLFRDLRSGEKSVIIGSTLKTGHGVNIQERLVALHHLDVPWRPADMVQREGRILRRGNTSESVSIYRYITKGSFDAYSWQLLEAKQRFISQILSGECTDREGSDIDETVLNYAEVKALAVGNPLIKKRVEVANELSKYKILERESIIKRDKQRKHLSELPKKIEIQEKCLRNCEKDIPEIDEILRAEAIKARKEQEAIDSRRKATSAKNEIKERYLEAEKLFKAAEKEAKKAERAVEKDAAMLEIASELRLKADELKGKLIPIKEELDKARETLGDARELVNESDDSAEVRELRMGIIKSVKENTDKDKDIKIASYRGFDVIVPKYMKPKRVKTKNEAGQLVESDREIPYVVLHRNGKYYVDVHSELGVLKSFDNVINNLRGKKAEFEENIASYKAESEALKAALDKDSDYCEIIQKLKAELDSLDEELGLKGA